MLSTMKSVYIELKKERYKRKKIFKKKAENNKINNNIDYEWFYDETKVIANKKCVIKAWNLRYHKDQHHSSDDENKSLEDLQTFEINNVSNRKFRKYVGKRLLAKIKRSVTKIRENEMGEIDADSVSNSINDNKKIIDSDSDEDENEKEETKIADTFVSKFMLSSDLNKEGELNLFHALRALPKRIGEPNYAKIELMNFSAVQMSIIAFQNDDKDELFNFYDKKMKKRLLGARVAAKNNVKETSVVAGRLTAIADKLRTLLQLNPSLLVDLPSKNDNKSESASEF